MIVDGHLIPETLVDPGAILSHEDRFGSGQVALTSTCEANGDRILQWTTGRDLLLRRAATAPSAGDSLPREPRGSSRSTLWIPPDETSASPVGPAYAVAVAEAGALLRVHSPDRITCIPGLTVAVDEERYEVVIVLDELDASARHHLDRRLRKGLPAVAAATADPAGPASNGEPGLPPAAATILADIRNAPLGTHHVAALERRGAGSLVDILANRGLILVLGSGQIISGSIYDQLAATLPAAGLGLDSREAARRWETSRGLARAILDRFAQDGMVDRVAPGNYKVN